jgi:hypothetical protein
MQLAYSAGVMKILHHRATRHFIALLVGCCCGKKFLHRLDRPVVACMQCGRVDDLERIIEKLRRLRAHRVAARAVRIRPGDLEGYIEDAALPAGESASRIAS